MLAIVIYLLIGSLTGFISGLIGVGGGIITIPALVLAYKFNGFDNAILMQLAAGTSLATTIVTTSVSYRFHIKLGNNVWHILQKMLIGISIGTIGGVTIARYLHSGILKILFGIFMIFVALRILFSLTTKPTQNIPNKIKMSGYSFTIGGISGLLGLSGGTLTIPFLLWRGINIRDAIATSLACSFLIAIVGTLSYMIAGLTVPAIPQPHTGYIYWPAVLCLIVTSPIFAILGTYVSHHTHITWLKNILGILLLLMAIKMLW